MDRQKIRKLILLLSFMLFPITMWYFSPAIIIMGLAQHILNGSFWVFLSMLILSMFFGRTFCGYLCPAGGLQECAMSINPNAANHGWRNNIKYVIWAIWMILLIITFILGKNDVTIDFFFMTDHGVSVTEVYNYVVYYGVLLLLFLPSLFHGRRAACHYICWMAPFMVIGSYIGRKLHLPQIHIEADKSKCISCRQCTQVCPMSLNVDKMVEVNHSITSSECIGCGACVDKCPKNVLSYSLKWRKKEL